MKHVIYYYNYLRNDGAPPYYFNVMKNQLKWDVTHSEPVDDAIRLNGKVDYHWWVDFGEDSFAPDAMKWNPPKDGGKSIYVASDTHLDNGYRYYKAEKFDFVYFNQLDAFKYYTRNVPSHIAAEQFVDWLPHAAEPQAYPKFDIVKKYDVCFIGHMQDRKNHNGITRIDFLDAMFKEFPNFYYGSRNPAFPGRNLFEDASKKFSQSRIILNISIKDDVNMRVFEALSSGSFLLTNRIPTLGELFEDKKHLVMYDSVDDAIEKARYYIDHVEEREQIARAGFELVRAQHTYRHRIETIAKIVGIT